MAKLVLTDKGKELALQDIRAALDSVRAIATNLIENGEPNKGYMLVSAIKRMEYVEFTIWLEWSGVRIDDPIVDFDGPVELPF